MAQISADAPQRRGARTLIEVLLALVLLYLAFAVILFAMQGRLLFFPTPSYAETPASAGWDYEEVTLDVGGETTYGWYVPADGESRGVVLFSHGNAGNIGDRLLSVKLFRELGYDTLVYDYGGYGQSSGSPSEQRCYADARAMWTYLTETRGIPPDDVALFGRSLGAAVSCQLATEVDAAAVVLESAFLSVPAMAKKLYPIFPFGWLIRNRFDNEAKAGAIRSPVLIVHSPDDEIIPYEHGRRLYELAPEPKHFLEIQGGHNEGFWMTGETYEQGLADFLATHLN